MPHCFLCLNFYFRLNVFSFWMFYIRNLPLQTFYFEPLINLMHKLGISWDCNRSGTYFPFLSASINSVKIHCKPFVHWGGRTHIVPSQIFLLTFWWSLCFYSLNISTSIYLYFIYLAWKRNTTQIVAFRKYLQCLLIK